MWREFPSGPEGIFLKRGRDVDVSLGGGFPFVQVTTREDPDQNRLYYGKSYIFPLFAAPFVYLFGTNGFLVLHAVLVTLMFLAAYAFLVARSHPMAAMVFAFAYVFVCVAPVYMVWMTPDFFNAAMVTFGYFFWCYKDVVGPNAVPLSAATRVRWFLGNRSDAIAAIFIGIATFSKPTHVLLIAPMLALGRAAPAVAADAAHRRVSSRSWSGCSSAPTSRSPASGTTRAAIGGRSTAAWAGSRTRPSAISSMPSVTTAPPNRIPLEVLTGRDAFVDVFRRNLGYFFFGRHTGFAAYYFPGVMAMLLFLAATRDRAVWQWLTLGAGLGSAVALLLYMPFTYSGGGGPVGNRYFLGVYPVFLFLTPPLQTAVPGLVAMAIVGLFTAQILSNPFYASFHPGEHTQDGALSAAAPRADAGERPAGERQPVALAPAARRYAAGVGIFPGRQRLRARRRVVLGARRIARGSDAARADRDGAERAGEVSRPLRIPRMEVHLETGPQPNRVIVASDAETRVIDMAPSTQQTFVLEMPRGLPYRPDPRFPTNFVYSLSIESATGFIPLFENGTRDNRFLGVFVRLVPCL